MAAGVGWIGNLLTSEFGALVTIGSVVTSAPLEPSPMVEEDWCSDWNFCVATCLTYYIPKKQVDLIQIGKKPVSYSHLRAAMRCTVSCGASNGIRKPHSKWSTWPHREMTDMSGPDKGNEEFAERCEEVIDEELHNRRLRAMVRVPGIDKRKESYGLLVNSGRV